MKDIDKQYKIYATASVQECWYDIIIATFIKYGRYWNQKYIEVDSNAYKCKMSL